MAKILIKQACVVTMNAINEVFNGDVLIENRRIVKMGQSLQETADKVIHAN
jgi:5-methylthioadenosine/S-adenosylhomocysteine deaminase